jgi:hypothetical protein
MILTGATVVLVGGGLALTSAQDQAETERAEHTMTLFDSRAAMVALGESSAQSVSFGQDSGVIETRPTDGYLMIKHSDYDDADNDADNDAELYNETLGAVVYENGDSELAYQGGGVWRKDAQGKAQVISPPEFHYRGETLTLPVVRVNGNASGSGSVSTRISASTRAEKVYPDQSVQYSNNSQYYLNPIQTGNVSVYVKSDYYRGWATYFRERTEGTVTVYDSNRTVEVELKTIGGAPGEFDMPEEGNSLPVRGLKSGHSLNDFSITVAFEEPGNGNGNGNGRQFTEGHWSFYSTQGGDQFEIHINTKGSAQCDSDDPSGEMNSDVALSVYYYNSNTDVAHEWVNGSIDPDDPDSAIDADCENKELTVDFVSDTTNLTYEEIDNVENVPDSDNKWEFGNEINEERPGSIELHPEDDSRTFNKGIDDATVEYVLNHYMSMMGVDYDLTVKDGPGNGTNSGRIDETVSSGRLFYEEADSGQFITYLHVTDNKININISN